MDARYLRTLSATRLAGLIRERRITSRQALEAHLDELVRVNPTLNAVVAERFDTARAEATLADEAVARGDDLGPLHGVPCTIKECFALEGMPWSAGLVARKDVRAPHDATAVGRLRAAGAIPMGVTNVSELCMWMESANRVYGRTRNPYDPSRIVGGSSGGEGAIVGAGASPFGLGSDVGGSIRMPAFFNGVFGHKPSGGLIPNSGQFPTADSAQALRYLTSGPICRRAEDLPLLVRLLAGPDGEDEGCEALGFANPDAVRLQDLVLLDVPDDGVTPVHASLRRAQRAAADHLHALGMRVAERPFPELRRALEIWSVLLGDATKMPFAERLGEGTRIPVYGELLRWVFGRSPHTFPALGLAVAEDLTHVLERLAPKRLDEARAAGRELREALDHALGDDGVMLYPSYAEPAPRHVAPMLPPTRWVYTAILNVMEVPATQVPLGLESRGLPTGVQVVARRGEDARTIAVARELERGFGGWVAPRSRAA
ncbi:MAG: amidase [Myxococcales bacterium]|nr:amidase [Myxococcales bacterium]